MTEDFQTDQQPFQTRSKEDLLAELKARRGEFSPEEIAALYPAGGEPQGETAFEQSKEKNQTTEPPAAGSITGVSESLPDQTVDRPTGSGFSSPSRSDQKVSGLQKVISAVAYGIGALVVIIGVILLSLEFWDDMSSFSRISITLGLGLVIFLGVVLMEGFNRGPFALRDGSAILSAFLTTLGFGVMSLELLDDFTPGLQLIAALVLAAMFGGLFALRRTAKYLFFLIVFLTWFLFAVLSLDSLQRTAEAVMVKPAALYLYLSFFVGLAYLIFGAYLNFRAPNVDTLSYRGLGRVLLLVGSLTLGSSLFGLGELYNTLAWDLLGLLMVAGLALMAARFNYQIAGVGGGLLLAVHFALISGIGLGFFSLIFLILLGAVFYWSKDRALPGLIILIATMTWFFYVLLSLGFLRQAATNLVHPQSVYLCLTSIVGLVYVFLGYFFDQQLQRFKTFGLILYVLGSLALIIPLFVLSFLYVGTWDILSITLIVLLIGLGIYVRRKTLLITAAGLLTVLIFIVSFRYFSETIGWPFALILAGLGLIGVGYMSYFLFQKLASG